MTHARSLASLMLLALCAAVAAGCGNSGATGPAVPTAAPVPNPLTQSLSQSGGPLQIPPLGGYGGTLSVPANNAPAGTTITLTSVLGTPANAPVPQSAARRTSSARRTLSAAPVVLFSLEVQLSQNVTFNGFPAFSITLPSTVSTAGEQFFIAAFQGTSAQAALLGTIGPASVSGQTLTFGASSASLTLIAQQTYLFELYEIPAASASPSPSASASAAPTTAPTATPTAVPTATPTASPSPSPTPTAGTLYVVNGGNNAIDVYAAGSSGNVAPLATIQGSNTQITSPFSIVVDSHGTAYVLDGTPSTTVVSFPYGASGNVAPATVLTTDPNAWGLALDPSGNIVLTDFRGNAVDFFAPGANANAAPISTIQGSATQLNSPYQAGFDGSGNIYVLNATTITVYPAGSTGNVAPTTIISGNATGLDGPEALAVDSSGRIYVGNSGNDTITVYAPGSTGNAAPIATLSGSAYNFLISQPMLSVDGNGNLYVASDSVNAVYVFAPVTSSSPTLLHTLSGSATLLNSPASAALLP